MNFSRIFFFLSIAITLSFSGFVFGFFTVRMNTNLSDFIHYRYFELRDLYQELTNRKNWELTERVAGTGAGITINTVDDDSLVFMSGYFDGENQARLVERDGTVLAKWPLNDFEFYSRELPGTKITKTASADTHGALLNPDGSLVFNFEYFGTYKLSRCNEPIWGIYDWITHHSVERAEGGGYWVLGRIEHEQGRELSLPPFSSTADPTDFREDFILSVSENGEVTQSKSIVDILYESDLDYLLTVGLPDFGAPVRFVWKKELVHANKVTELPSDIADKFPMFDAGDLAVSLRGRNLVFVVDPDTWKVLWYQIGPWVRQHDPEFNADGTIMIFNNNTYPVMGRLGRELHDGHSNIMRVDPATGAVDVVYGNAEDQFFLSTIRGKHDVLPDGGLLITEFEGGRVFQVDADGNKVWEYVNRIDEATIGEIPEARVYPRSYFEISDFGCE